MSCNCDGYDCGLELNYVVDLSGANFQNLTPSTPCDNCAGLNNAWNFILWDTEPEYCIWRPYGMPCGLENDCALSYARQSGIWNLNLLGRGYSFSGQFTPRDVVNVFTGEGGGS